MSPSNELVSPPLDSDRTRDLVLALERHGLETGRIHVEARPPLSRPAVSRTDQESVTRPGQRVAIGLVAGAVVGALLGVIAASVVDLTVAPTVLALAIGSAIVGGLAGLYSRLPMNTEVVDADAGSTSRLRVDVSDLPDTDIADIEQILAAA